MSEGAGVRLETTSTLGSWATLRRGLQVSPQIARGFGVTALLATLAAAGRVVVPITVQQTIDTGILADGGPRVGRVTLLVVLAALALVAAGACSAAVNVRLFRRSEEGLAGLRVAAFRRVHDLSVLTQGTERRGSLVSRVTGDVDTISLFVQWGGIMLLVSVLQIAVATGLMLVYSWQLAVVVWLAFLPLMLVLRPAQKRVSVAYATVRARTGAMLGAISEAVVGAETIRAYGVGARTERRIDRAIRATRDGQVGAQNRVATVFSSGVLVANLVLAAVVVVGTLLGVDGQITAGRLLAFLFLVQLFTGPVQMATEILNELQNALAGWRRVLGVIDTEAEIADPPGGGRPSPRGAGRVELRGVGFAYPGATDPVLRDVSFVAAPGETTAIIGSTGSGKTTLLGTVPRLYDATEGAVLVDGVDVRDLELDTLWGTIGLVPQKPYLFSGTVASNVRYGKEDATDEEVWHALEVAQAADFVREMGGLDAEIAQGGTNVSGGQRQRLAIARALVRRPEIYLFDDSFSALDFATDAALRAALAPETKDATVVVVAQRVSTIRHADRIVVLDDGTVVGIGTHDELMSDNETYREIVLSQVTEEEAA